MELPYFQEFHEKYKEHGLQVIAVNIFPDQDDMLPEWKERLGIQFPILIGVDTDSLVEDYRLEATPLNFLLDSEGNIVKRFDQYFPGAEADVESAITGFLGL